MDEDPLEDHLRFWRMHSAAIEGDLAALQTFLDAGDDINAFDVTGQTPLHFAAEHNRIPAMRFLLAHGADVNAIDESVCGDTPLGSVAGNCSLEVAQLLISAGADPHIRGHMWLTAIDRAKDRKRGDGPAVYQLLSTARRSR
jgi:ankyrin repeat protein